MHVVVFGAGGLGSLMGALLARANEVTLVGREDHVTAVERDGLRVTGEFDLQVAPDARTDPPATADLVLVTVKSFDTESAAAQLADAMSDVDAVLSLQNGMGNEATLAGELPWPVLAGTCTYGARLTDPGVVRCNGVGEVTIGPYGRDGMALAERVVEAFRDAGIEATADADIRRQLWQKLAVNAGINATTALARLPNGALLDGPATRTAREAAREAATVAQSEGSPVSPDRAVAALDRVVDDTAGNASSMRQDVRRGRRTEIDAINGYVVAQADVPVPVNETLTDLVRAWEAKRGLR